jgi:hypothetical protein
MSDHSGRSASVPVGSPEPVKCFVSELRAGEENDGRLESTDLFIQGRGVQLLCNVPAGQGFTYSLIVDSEPTHGGWVGQEALAPRVPEPSAPAADLQLGDLLYAHGERESIKALLSDRSEVSTYLKVEAVVAELEKLQTGRPQPVDPYPHCPRCKGTGEEPNAQFRCPCRWRHADAQGKEAAAPPVGGGWQAIESAPICTNCGESAKPLQAYADFVGPFCDGCWDRLREHFTSDVICPICKHEHDRETLDCSGPLPPAPGAAPQE